MRRLGAHLRMALAALLLGVASHPAAAVQPDEILPDAALEARARQISEGLRCLVCQNQSIDDSDAPLARDLRLLVRERLKAGDSDEAVRSFLVDRYGEFVLLKPPFSMRTLLLWFTPLVVLALAGVLAWRGLGTSRQRASSAPAPLSAEEQARLDDLLRRD